MASHGGAGQYEQKQTLNRAFVFYVENAQKSLLFLLLFTFIIKINAAFI